MSDVGASDTFGIVRAKILGKAGILPDWQSGSTGRKLVDGRLLTSYDIQ